jgi:ABC-2 type transport system ATP-binding protein
VLATHDDPVTTVDGASPVIRAEQLTKYYGTRRGVIELDFRVDPGEVFGFLGPNGAGKTTTIRLLLGFLKPTSGRVVVNADDAWLSAPQVHRSVAYLGSDPGFLGELSAGRMLDYLATLRGLPHGAWRQLAERFELDPSVAIRKLSSGNRQKVAVVQAFMGAEPLLVLDEPTSGLDPLMQREFLTLVADARAAGRTVFLSSHNLQEVERSCDRVGIVREGRLVDISAVQDLMAEHWRSVNLVLEYPPPDGIFDLPNVRTLAQTGQMLHLMVQGDVNPLLRRIAELSVRDVSITTPDIEDVFMRFYEGTSQAAEDLPPAPTAASRSWQ